MGPKEPRSQIGGMMPTKINYEKLKRNGWRDDHVLIVSIDDMRLSWPEKEFLTQIANKLYGRKK